jgi:hypothetical protein
MASAPYFGGYINKGTRPQHGQQGDSFWNITSFSYVLLGV